MRAIMLLLSLLSVGVTADTQPFTRQSLERILADYQNQPMVLAFWSLDCTYCQTEMRYFGNQLKQTTAFHLVLVATDSISDKAQIDARLAELNLTGTPSWAFAQSAESLRFHIDQDWYGELPRTYFFYADGRVEAKSGQFNEAEFQAWLNASRPHNDS